MYGRKDKEVERPVNKNYLGGQPIILEDVLVSDGFSEILQRLIAEYFQKLKTVCWGGPKVIPRPEFMRGGIIFNPAKSPQSYGLNALRGASKSFLLLVQSYVLKHLLFHGKSAKKNSK